MGMRRSLIVGGVAALALALAAPGVASAASPGPRFGPNVVVFGPTMPQDQIQAELNSIATQQVPNQFGTQRYAIFFEPGSYGSAANPLIFQVGYYTQVAGLGAQPGDVTIDGPIDVFNQCPSGGGACEAPRQLLAIALEPDAQRHLAQEPSHLRPGHRRGPRL
jgi:hypothetical protein